MQRLTTAITIAILIPALAAAQATPPKPDTAQKLPTATVRDAAGGNLPEPYIRRSQIKGAGKFLTAKDIEKLGPPHTPQLLARISGGDIRDIGGGEVAIVGSRGTRMSFSSSVPNELCVVGVAVNETRVPAGYDLKAIKLEDIAALEFYSGPASIPLELGGSMPGDANCGLFVIWLKDYRRRP